LDAAATVDVEVREDAEEPGAHVRPRGEAAPATEGPRIRFLHQILRFFPSGNKPSCHTVDLIGERERFLLEPHPVAGFCRDQAASGLRLGITHRPTVAA
jgi:hypothetical protein